MGTSDGFGQRATARPLALSDAGQNHSTDDDDPDRTVIRPVVSAPRVDDDATVVRPLPAAPSALPAPARSASAQPTQALALPTGFRLHEYRIDRLLGQGGFGLTYLASDVNLNARVAIKEYLPADFAYRSSDKTVSAASTRHRERYRQGLDSFLVEARTLATFRHPNIVRVARFFEAHQTAYMVLDYEQGDALKTWWPAHRELGEAELVHLLQPLLDGLAVVHGAGYLHRDIKPDNIYVRQADGSLVLLDFGSARQAVGGSSSGDDALTPGYAPIEQYEDGEQGAFTDLYGLGATLYWMVTGKKPPEATRRGGAIDPMQPARDAGQGRFSDAFLGAIDWALQPLPARRPQDVAQFRKALFAGQTANLGLQDALRAHETLPAASGTPSTLAHARRAGSAVSRVTARRAAFRLANAGRRLATPSSWPLALKMSLAMVLTALLPMLITGWYNLRGSVESVTLSELRTLQQLARSTAGRLTQLIGDSRHLTAAVGTDTEVAACLAAPDEANRSRIRARMLSLLAGNEDVQSLMLLDAEGRALVSSDPTVEGLSFQSRQFFQAAMRGRRQDSGVAVGSGASSAPAAVAAAVSGAAGLYYASPVADAQGAVLGAVVLRLKDGTFAAILNDVSRDTPRVPFVVDADGVIVFHPDPRALYSSLVPLPAATLAAIRADQRFRRDTIHNLDMPALAQAMLAQRSEGHVSYWSTLWNADAVAGFAPVPGQRWMVGVTETREHFEAPLHRLFQHTLWSLLLAGSLFVVLALMFARSIVRPVRALTTAAHALKSGDYAQATVRVTSRDELGQLARTFNVMIDVLRQRERERERAERSTTPRG